ncbi:holin [Nocardia cyriacigeorgica]|uniref:holin n=1 Tax=Nocardia cyriacigeorgica TaxID=135487 RepID=UPI00245668EC|nr:holin [Nocardia cyriacigeorgica]
MWSKTFWKATAERAVKTFVQVLAASLAGMSLLSTDWNTLAAALGLAGISAGMSVLTSLASVLRGEPDSPSLVNPPPTPRHGLPSWLG